MKTKKDRNEARRQFLITFFDKEEDYDEKYIHGFWLIKSWNGGTKKWQVAIYPEESYRNYKMFGEAKKLDQEFNNIDL